jgi:hypothetical protein
MKHDPTFLSQATSNDVDCRLTSHACQVLVLGLCKMCICEYQVQFTSY